MGVLEICQVCFFVLSIFSTLPLSFLSTPLIGAWKPNTYTHLIVFSPLRSIPVMLNGTASIPPATAVNYVPWTIVGFIFQYIVRRRHFGWWSKYNCTSLSLSPSYPSHCSPLLSIPLSLSPSYITYIPHQYPISTSNTTDHQRAHHSLLDVLSAALDAGTAIGTILIFFW